MMQDLNTPKTLTGKLFLDVLVCAALAMAMGLATAGFFPVPSSSDYLVSGTLKWSSGWARQETREKAFYLSFLFLIPLLGFFGGLLAGRFRLNSLVVISGLVLFVVVFGGAAGAALRSSGFFYPVAPLLVLLATLAISHIMARHPVSTLPTDFCPRFPPRQSLRSRLGIPVVLLSIGVLAVLIFPASGEKAARGISYNPHVVSFISGPATYQFHGALIPGRDYFTQYSIGFPAVFFPFLGNSAQEMLVRYVYLFSGVLLLFYTSLFFLINWLYDSWKWALFLCVFIFLIQCHFNFPFCDPSSFPLRYPLLAATAFSAGLFAASDARWRAYSILHGILLGGSVFLNTETGVYACVATACLACVPGRPVGARVKALTLAGVTTLLSFFVMSLVSFGPGVISLDFVVGILEPLILYGGGLGAWLMPWEWKMGEWGLPWFANIVVPLVAAATCLWYGKAVRILDKGERARCAALFYLSVSGLLMTAKYINMSLLAVWIANATALLVVVFFWVRLLEMHFKDSRQAFLRATGYFLPAASGIVGVLFLLFFNEARNPTEYGLRSYVAWPSLLNETLRITRPGLTPELPKIPVPEDILLIAENTRRDERVAIYDQYDWAYLVGAKRASMFYFLPSHITFTKRQLQGSQRNRVDKIFLPVEPLTGYGVKPEDLVPDLPENFCEIKRGVNLKMMRRTASVPQH